MTLSGSCSHIKMPIKCEKEGVMLEIALTNNDEEELDLDQVLGQ